MHVKEKAPAKLNLGLRITGKREDGYHNILSIFQTVCLYDELSLTSSAESVLSSTADSVPTDHENLILRAEDIFRKRFGITGDMHFSLKKLIPVGAGLAGGSSDAAAALRGLKRFYGVEISDSDLHECAAMLGSDIPFLLQGGTAIVSGRGEYITPVEWPFKFTYVIVYPDFAISTEWAYSNLGKCVDDNGAYQAVIEKLENRNLETEEFFRALRNDFEPVVFEHYPIYNGLKRKFEDYGARAAILTGSGSSMFGIFEDKTIANRCADQLKNDFSEVFTVKAYTFL